MSTTTFPFLTLPAEIRAEIYTHSFATRSAPFEYQNTLNCQHKNLKSRTFFALSDINDGLKFVIKDLTFNGCSSRIRRPHTDFLALRLTCRQIYLETYHFVKLPPIQLRSHVIGINENNIGAFLDALDVEHLKNHVQEMRIGFHPICHHSFGPFSISRVLSNIWVSMVRVLWKDYGSIQEQLCEGDGGVTIRPLAELLATFPQLKKFDLDIVRGCGLPCSKDLVEYRCLDVLRERGMEVPQVDF